MDRGASDTGMTRRAPRTTLLTVGACVLVGALLALFGSSQLWLLGVAIAVLPVLSLIERDALAIDADAAGEWLLPQPAVREHRDQPPLPPQREEPFSDA